MLYLATPSSPDTRAAIEAGQLGAMLTPYSQNRPPTEGLWAADTGCFRRPFDGERYLRWLGTCPADRCLFATAPDVFGDGRATYERALPLLEPLRQLGYRPAYVVQPGTPHPPWDRIGALFVGGPDDWQTSDLVADLVAEARRRGLWTHRGRVNTWRRFVATLAQGYDSCDGTKIAFGPDANLPVVLGWVARAAALQPLALAC